MPTQEQGAAFVSVDREGPVVMLNLLRFRAVADYREHPDLEPPEPISGAEAYRRYVENTLPILSKVGSEILFRASGGAALIGPSDERWDLVVLVRHQSAQAFLGFAQDPAYLAGAGHRIAALADSRLIPLTEV